MTAATIPTPIRLVLGDICSVCSCPWSMLQGAPNLREVGCMDRGCPCHSSAWSGSLYEGSDEE